MLGRTIPASAGYPNYSGTALIPTIHRDRVLTKFYTDSIFPMITTTDYLDELGGRGDVVTFMKEPCGIQVRDHIKDGVIQHDTLEISECAFSLGQAKEYSFKIAHIDKMMMGARWDRIKDAAINLASRALSQSIDCEIMNLMVVESHCANAGPNAGAISQMYDLGQPGAPVALTALNILEKLTLLQAVLDEQNINQEGRFVILPAPARTVLMNSEFRSACFGNCNSGTSTYITGEAPGTLAGFDIYFSNCAPKVLDTGVNAQCYYIIAGLKQATAFAANVDYSRIIDGGFQNFDTYYQGLMSYGYAIIYPEALATMYVRFA